MNQSRQILESIYQSLLHQAEIVQSLIESINWDQMTPADEERIRNVMIRFKSILKPYSD